MKSKCDEVIRIHESEDEVKNDLAEYIAQISDASVKDRGVFTIALSHASLIRLMGKLCESPYNKTVEWSKWYVFWADERLVPKNHAHSNYKLAKDAFLSKVPIVPSHVLSINDSVSAEEAAEEYEFVMRQLVKSRVVNVSDTSDCPKFDLILLGLGEDGHVASLFPHHHSALNEKQQWVTFTTTTTDSDRITFTFPVINSASNVALVATGDAKADAVHLAVDDVGPECPVVPARMVRPAKGKLVWFLDKPAASKLETSK
ncbi:putative 6-phosphogluconolactonase 2 [Senna tora]|uniref:Probable 6-phosphogluconolactonase n=1 Tax=Senna tora TaxID=362788 RepID=A0A834SW97_9FABA|nr:putative 6-phosphogluconolactonase 2 [Senna tora]